MRKSLRSIGNLLFMVSVLTFSASVLGTTVANCGSEPADCLAGLSFGYENAMLAYRPDMTVAQSTVAYSTGGMPFSEIVSAVQLVSVYGLLLAVIILIGLECAELYYIRQLLGVKHGHE